MVALVLDLLAVVLVAAEKPVEPAEPETGVFPVPVACVLDVDCVVLELVFVFGVVVPVSIFVIESN